MTRIKTIPSSFINDPTISIGAKWLFFYINSKKPLWTSNTKDMALESRTVPDQIEFYEQELLDNDYMDRKFEETREWADFYSYTLFKKSISKTSEIDRQNSKKILAYWNAKWVVVHRVVTPSLQYQIEKSLQIYTYEDICIGIDNYTNVYKSKVTYWEHKWTLEDFLKRSGGMGKFLYMTEKDFIDKSKVWTVAAKKIILEENKIKETDEQREQRLKEAEVIKYENELREYFWKLKEETRNMIISNALVSIKEKEEMSQTHPYLYDILKKQAIKQETEKYRSSKFIT